MAIGVDISTRKPRKIKGTPAAKVRNIVSAGILGFGLFFGFFYQMSSITGKYRTALSRLYEDPEEEVERRQLIASGLPLKTGDQIREMQKDYERPDRPDK